MIPTKSNPNSLRRALFCVFVPLALLVPFSLRAACAEQKRPHWEAVSPSPFGVVCPWSGIDEAGIRWCRVGAGATALTNWPDIQKAPNTWDWTAADNELKNLANPLGLSLLPIFGYTPKWASRESEGDLHFAPPRDLRQFSRFVYECVLRFRHRVKVWEVWNEPNINFFHGSAAEYAEMVKAAAVTARQADPECRIAMGCAGVDVDFLRRLYEFGCGPYFDVMSVHPYQWGPEFNDGWMVQKLEACRRLMDEHGDEHKPIWITEIGWSLGEGIKPAEQADLLAQAFVTALSVRDRLNAERVFWFSVKDWGSPGHGLMDVDGKPKPALTAYRAVTQSLEGARYLGPWKTPTGVRGHLFDRGGQPVLVLWTPSPQGRVPVELAANGGKPRLRTVDNQEKDLTVQGGKVVVEASHAPIFVTGLKVSSSDYSPAAVPSAKPRQRSALADVWLSLVPPEGTMRPYLVLGGTSDMAIRVHNDGAKQARVEIALDVRHGQEATVSAVAPPVVVPPQSTSVVRVPISLRCRPELAGQLATVHLRGRCGEASLADIRLPVRLARWKAVEFLANSWTEKAYCQKGEKTGCADSVRFGGELNYRFDLRHAKSATLSLLVGANGANAWNVLVSKDDKTYHAERSGKSWPAWHTIQLDKYLDSEPREGPSPLYLKIQGTDCQLRELVMEMAADVVPATWKLYEKSPTELVVYDARPELGIGMHGVDDESLRLVQKLGIRFVRHTMYWNLIENTASPGVYDANQLRAWDELARRCDKQGVRLVVVVHGNPPGVDWSHRSEGYDRFARFLYDMARRYPQIRYWELWNEMDSGFTDLFGAGRAEVPLRERGKLYAEMLKRVYPRIKQANAEASVLTGGMTDWGEFPRGIYEGGGRDYFDIMALHTYGVPVDWAFSGRGLALRQIMAQHGDAEKPLWNTEFGIDAGNFVGAWGYPHDHKPPRNDGEFFDSRQRGQWEACLKWNRELGLYAKVLPYQFHAGNERDDDGKIRQRAQLPGGMTIDDYGFGIVRRDGKTPRPLYQWLLDEQWNRAIQASSGYEVEVRHTPRQKVVPIGYEYSWDGKTLVIPKVRVDSLQPTRIRLKPAD